MRTACRAAQGAVCQAGGSIRTSAILLSLLLLAGGCSSKRKNDTGSQDPGEKEPAPERQIYSDKLKLEQRDDSGELMWVARGESSKTVTQEGGNTRTELDKVDGEIYEDGVIVSRFRAAQGFADDKNKAISLQGSVQVTSEKQKTTLTADIIRWDDAEKLYDARGNVKIKSEAYEAKAERLLADSRLKRVSTPNLFNQ